MGAGAAYEAHGNAVFQLGELDKEIAAANEDLGVAEEDLAEAQGRLEERASTMYKSGNVGFVDVLVGAENFSEFANRLELWVRLLARERAEFDRVREIRDLLAEKKAFLEATREQRVEALGEADSQLDQASALEADAQSYLDSLNAELRAALEAEQSRRVEEARAAGERLRAEIAETEPEAVQPVVQPAPQAVKIEDVPAEAIPAGVITEAPKAQAPEKTVESEPVAATVPESPQPVEEAPAQPVEEAPAQPVEEAPAQPVEEAPAQPVEEAPAQPVEEAPAQPVEEAPEVDLAAQRQADRQALEAAKAAAEQRAAEQAAAEVYAAEKAAAAEEARLAAEQATATEEQYAADQVAEAERRAELAAQRAAAEQQAAEKAAAQQAEAEKAAAQQAEAEQQATGQQYSDDQDMLVEQQQYGDGSSDQVEKQQYDNGTEAGGLTVDEPSNGQYDDGGSAVAPAAPAAPAAQPATGPAPAASASGSAVIAEAASHMGTPYVFSPPGPCSANVAEDCSCHTMLVFQAFGISLPDDPVAQYGMGTPVSGPPQAGDLVFWAEGGAGITHVGIATGNGTTIHASSYAGFVTETPIDAIPGYVGARRVL